MAEHAHSLRIVRTIPHPRDRTFRGWSDLDLSGRWFMGTWGRTVEGEFRPGGRYRIEGVMPSGTRVACAGEFTEIEAPARVVHTFEWFGDPDDPHSQIPEVGPRPITVTLEEVDGGTEVTFAHEGLETEGSARGHREAWIECLSILEGLLAVEPGAPPRPGMLARNARSRPGVAPGDPLV